MRLVFLERRTQNQVRVGVGKKTLFVLYTQRNRLKGLISNVV